MVEISSGSCPNQTVMFGYGKVEGSASFLPIRDHRQSLAVVDHQVGWSAYGQHQAASGHDIDAKT